MTSCHCVGNKKDIYGFFTCQVSDAFHKPPGWGSPSDGWFCDSPSLLNATPCYNISNNRYCFKIGGCLGEISPMLCMVVAPILWQPLGIYHHVSHFHIVIHKWPFNNQLCVVNFMLFWCLANELDLFSHQTISNKYDIMKINKGFYKVTEGYI